MNYEILKTYKKHFSLLGLMYFLGALIIIGVQVAVSMLVLAFAPSLLDNPNLSLLVSMLPTYTIAFPLTSLLIHQVPGVQMKKHNMKPTQLLGAFAISYALMYLSNLAGQFFTNIIGIIKGSPVDDAIADLVSELNPLTAFFVMVLLAPALEEWIFRKLLVDRTIRYGEGTAIFLSGLMFGLFHGNLNQFVYTFLIGAFWAFIYVKYEGYISRQEKQVEQFKKLEKKKIPDDIHYDDVKSLRLEAVQKLKEYRPSSIGQASRISGVSPADISVLLVYLSSGYKNREEARENNHE